MVSYLYDVALTMALLIRWGLEGSWRLVEIIEGEFSGHLESLQVKE